jgi:hypothetical protein
MKIFTIVLFSIAGLFVTACATPEHYTQAQLNALETRIVEADFTDSFNAASGALFDDGYIITMSDREGGLITGHQTKQPTAWEQFWGPYPVYASMEMSIQVRESGPQRCFVRVKTATNGATRLDREAIERIWILMQRQVLMIEPPASDEAPPD